MRMESSRPFAPFAVPLSDCLVSQAAFVLFHRMATPRNNANRKGLMAPILLGLAVTLFFTGVFFPFFHVSKFWVFSESVSVAGGIITLLQEGEYFLFAVLTLFTLVFPCVKLGLLGIIWLEHDKDLTRVRRLHQRVSSLGKWSMLDVFVVAILIVTIKAAGLARIQIGLGLYSFTFSVIVTQLASARLSQHLGPATNAPLPYRAA